jgi:hypothetical protein
VFLLLISGMAFAQTTMNDPEMWYTYDDIGNGGSSKITLTTKEEKIDGQTVFAIHATGSVTTKFVYGFIGFGVRPTGAALEKVKKAKGVKFKVIGDGKKYRFRAETTDIKDFCYYGKDFYTQAGVVKEYTIPFNYCQQESWGTKTGFAQKNIWQLSFQTSGQPHESIDIKIYDFQLVE